MKSGLFSGAAGLLRSTTLAGGIVGMALALSACEEPQPRGFAEFMEDSIAREGVLARCDQDPRAAGDDMECANARRAAVAIALEGERERLKALEQESERKLEQLRERVSNAERAAAESAAAAAAAEEQAYERFWREQTRAASDSAATGSAAPPSADTSTEWPSAASPLPFSPLDQVENVSDGELAEASLDNGNTPAP